MGCSNTAYLLKQLMQTHYKNRDAVVAAAVRTHHFSIRIKIKCAIKIEAIKHFIFYVSAR